VSLKRFKYCTTFVGLEHLKKVMEKAVFHSQRPGVLLGYLKLLLALWPLGMQNNWKFQRITGLNFLMLEI
jgi:hypothetical protein